MGLLYLYLYFQHLLTDLSKMRYTRYEHIATNAADWCTRWDRQSNSYWHSCRYNTGGEASSCRLSQGMKLESKNFELECKQQSAWCRVTYQIHSFIPLARAEFDDSLPFSGASSILFCYVLFPTNLSHQLFFHPLSLHLVIYFLVYLSILLFPNSYIILFCEFYFLPFSVHALT